MQVVEVVKKVKGQGVGGAGLVLRPVKEVKHYGTGVPHHYFTMFHGWHLKLSNHLTSCQKPKITETLPNALNISLRIIKLAKIDTVSIEG